MSSRKGKFTPPSMEAVMRAFGPEPMDSPLRSSFGGLPSLLAQSPAPTPPSPSPSPSPSSSSTSAAVPIVPAATSTVATCGSGEGGAAALGGRNFFQPIARPGPGDWLWSQRECGQDFDSFLATCGTPSAKASLRDTVYLLPLGHLDIDLHFLQRFAQAYLATVVHLMEPWVVQKNPDARASARTKAPTDVHKEKHHQVYEIPGSLPSTEIVEDTLPSMCLVAITMEDLYSVGFNWVFGLAENRVGVFSFARYLNATANHSLLWRSCQTLVHETLHLFNFEHCIYYNCVMNGSNSLEEADNQPMQLCPICLRKLHAKTGCNIQERYRKLLQLYVERIVQFEYEVEWTNLFLSLQES
ncbi:Zn-dependent protease [Pelomyxa schiedti]|nr:Zn-dependent protease [Pelomyxa schiedti]